MTQPPILRNTCEYPCQQMLLQWHVRTVESDFSQSAKRETSTAKLRRSFQKNFDLFFQLYFPSQKRFFKIFLLKKS